MCGITALIGSRQAAPQLLEGLRQLEYRGYDSAGIATVDGAGMHGLRAEGAPGQCGIGHRPTWGRRSIRKGERSLDPWRDSATSHLRCRNPMKATPIPIESICCIGAGYVGWPTMAVIADRCPEAQVTVVDLNAERTAAWNDPDLAQLPVYEPDLNAVVCRVRGPSLQFSTAVEEAIASVDMVFISVNTPTKTRGLGAGQTSDLKWVEASPRTMAWAVCEHTIVVEKSTQPVRTFAVLSNPEFMAKGTAIAYQETPNWELISGKEPEAYRYLPGLPASGNLPTGPSLQAFRGDREQRHDKGIIDLTNHLKENRLRQSAINGPRHHCKSRSEMHTNQIDTNPDPNPSTSAQSINTLLSQSAPTSKQGDECND